MKKIVNNADEIILNAVKKFNSIVSSTLGPKGYNVMIDRNLNYPMVTKDGVTVADNVQFNDKVEDTVVRLIRGAASKMSSEVGDGTTTATVIACTTVESLLPVIREHNLNVYKISEILNNYANIVEKYISKKSIVVDASSKKKQKLLESVIKVSTNGDKELTSLIYNTILTVKSDGALTVKESKTSESHVEYVDGYKIDSGLLLSNFITNISRGNTELQNPLILIAKDKITSTKEQILPLLNYCNRKGRPLVVITMDIDQEPLGAILINHLEHNVHSAVIRLEGPIARKEWVMDDLAKLTGATIVDSNMNKPFYKIDYETWLGTANTFVADRFISNLIVKEKTQDFKDYMSYLGHLLDNSKGIDKQRLIERIAKLEGSSATIYVGGETDAEIKEKMDRIDDAVSAARAALSGGIISGGGSELYRLSYLSENIYSNSFPATKESRIIAEVVSKILRSPMNMIIHNALGGSEVTENVKEALSIVATENNMGIDVSNELELSNMISCGIVDPAMVTIKAVKTGLSVAALLLTTKFIIVNENDEYVLNNQNPLPYAF